VAEISSLEALDDAQFLAVRMTTEVEPRGVLESDRFNDERVVLPSSH